jgi:hypothetical protein
MKILTLFKACLRFQFIIIKSHGQQGLTERVLTDPDKSLKINL